MSRPKPAQPAAPTDHPLNQRYLALARNWSLWSVPLDQALQLITRAVAHAMPVARASAWCYSDDRHSITLRQLYDRGVDAFSHGTELRQQNYPRYFEQLHQARIIDAADLATDPRTTELHTDYATPNRIGALLDVPLRRGGQLWGVLSIEHVGGSRSWSDSERWFAVSVADLISQLLTYDAMRASEQRLRFLGDHLPVGVLRTNTEGDCLYVNPQWCELTGQTPAQSIGRDWLETLHPEDRSRVFDDLMVALSDDSHAPLHVSECRLQGAQTRWLAYRWVIERDELDMPIGAIGTFTDITTERESRRRLQENEQRYRALFENSGDAVLLMRGDRFIDCNQASESLFGASHEQILRSTPMDFSPTWQLDGSTSLESAQHRIAAALTGERQHFEWMHRRADGSDFLAEVTLNCIELDDGPLLLAAVRDVSERRSAEQALARSYQRVSWINRLSQELHQQRDLLQVADTALTMLGERIQAPLLRFASRDGDRLVQITERGELAGRLAPIDVDATILPGFMDGQITYLDVGTELELAQDQRAAALALGLTNYIVMMLVDSGRLLGCVSVGFGDPALTSRIETEDLRAFANTLTLALANLHHLHEIEYRAEHDSLTDLPNRSLLHRELAPAIEAGQPLALMLLDLDRFKEVNDALGHPIGDRLLCRVGPRLAETLEGTSHLLCRLGGDEFAVLVHDLTPAQALDTARALQRATQQPFDLDGMSLQIGTSVGVAFAPEHGRNSHELLRAADVAMYNAKRNGLGVAVYSTAIDTNTPERLALIAELHEAIRGGGLVLHYQPKIALGDRRVIGFEALVRWQHPRLGLLAPGAFVPFAEVSDAIHALTYEVLRQSLLQQRRWRSAGLPAAIAVNLSARNLAQGDFFEQLQRLLTETGADPTLLELEITETSLLHDPRGAAQLLGRIAELGVQLSIDDFGTGYSSLAYLRRLPIHALKIDRTFVHELAQNEQDAVIVRSTIALAHNLNLKVVAEGVEDAATLDQLREMGCDLAQGFHISRPQPATAIEVWLNQYP